MRIRHDSVFISSILFTIALVSLLPWCLSAAYAGRHDIYFEQMDPGFQAMARTMGQLGVASVAIISIGLIVTWMGYFTRVRWTWFVMFIIVWGWVFPVLAKPYLGGKLVVTWSEFLNDAIRRPGTPRSVIETILIFVMMLIALALPIRSFLKHGEKRKSVTAY